MNRSWIDQLKTSGERISQYWQSRSSKQKWLTIGTFIVLVAALSTFIYISSRPEYVPLYSGQLTQRDVGDIKAELDKEGDTNYQITGNGTVIQVPRKDAANLVVTLASKGFPKDNSINYDVFNQNLSFGATDRQYNILQQQAMQNQVADVLKHVDGIKNAEVILTLPNNSVFVKDDQSQKATASVMVEVEPGTELNAQQIRALYTLVSKSVPNLPMENITIMNQYSETLLLQDNTDTNGDPSLDKYTEQQKIQTSVQQGIQQNLQSLLGTVLGTNKVYVSTFVKLNFDQEKTQEKLVQPVDKNGNGIIISAQKDNKSYKGNGANAGGVTGTGSTDVPGYSGSTSSGNGTYDESQSTINYEVNRINNEIIKSPYQIQDITINVGVEGSASNPNSLPKATQNSIRNIVSNTVLTALGHPNMSQQQINQHITIFPHQFASNSMAQTSGTTNNNWIYLGAAAALGALLVGGLVWLIGSRRKKKDEAADDEELDFTPRKEAVPEDYFVEQEMSVENQLKKLLDKRPEDFAKVIRTWMNEEEV